MDNNITIIASLASALALGLLRMLFKNQKFQMNISGRFKIGQQSPSQSTDEISLEPPPLRRSSHHHEVI